MKRILSIVLICVLVCCCFVNVSAAKVMRGDVNNDGNYDTLDYLLMRKALAENKVVDLSVYDVNDDNAFNLSDINAYAKYLIKTGSLKIDESAGWNTLYDWENETAGVKPSSNVFDTENTEFSVQNLSRYSLENNKNISSNKALALYSYGLVDYSKQEKERGTNPTTKEENSYINTANMLTNATNLRVTLSTAKTDESQFFCAYIGCQVGSKHYFYKIDNTSYKNDFGYFYFVGKKFTRFINGNRFTYLNEPETKVLTKDDVKNIKKIDFWIEAQKTSTPLIIDDIEYFDGSNGYDSTVEDNFLPVTQEETNDGTQKYLAIAFDDGPQKFDQNSAGTIFPKNQVTNEYYMKYYMDLAAEYGAHLTFFLQGSKLNADSVSILQRAVNEGHELANHTWSHNRLTSLSDDKIVSEVKQVDDWLNTNIGVKTSFIRYPFYDTNSNVKNVINQNCPNIKASIAGDCPSDFNYTSVDYRKWYYKGFVKDGTITLTHENIIDNVEVVRWLLDYYSKLGYQFVTVSELFDIKGVTPSVLNSDYYTVK